MDPGIKKADRNLQSCLNRHPLIAVGAAILMTLVLASGIQICIESVNAWAASQVLHAWEAPAWMHSILSVVLVSSLVATNRHRHFFSLFKVNQGAPSWLQRNPTGLLQLTGIFLCMVFAAGLISRTLIPTGPHLHSNEVFLNAKMPPWAFILWVPWVEEIVYRVGLGGVYQRCFPGWLGIWFGSILFSMVHAPFSLHSILHGAWGMPLGPFLLGIMCGWAFRWTGNVWNPVAIHAACNGSAMIFTFLDPRWLDWLQVLYLAAGSS